MEEFNVRLQKALALSGLKQADIVERTGIGKGMLSSYLSGKYKPKQNNTYKLALVLNVNEAWLMGLDVPMERGSSVVGFKLTAAAVAVTVAMVNIHYRHNTVAVHSHNNHLILFIKIPMRAVRILNQNYLKIDSIAFHPCHATAQHYARAVVFVPGSYPLSFP